MCAFTGFRGLFRRWLIFNFVGAMGIVIQMTALAALISGFGLAYLLATALAVEAAVLHNFLWHEHWTWSDRISSHPLGFLTRLLRFHLTNGILSLTGNLLIMHLLVGKLGLNYLPANGIAIVLCSILNFMAGDRFVFRPPGPPSAKGVPKMVNKASRFAVSIFSIALGVFLTGICQATAAELKPETLNAWENYVQRTERRIRAELASQSRFLTLDFQDPAASSRERQAVLAGEIPIREMKTVTDGNRPIDVPDGMIHHWRGSVLIPGVTLDFVLSRVNNPKQEDTRQEDVLDSRVLEQAPGQLKLFLKLQRSKIVTVVYNTEHMVRYQKHEAGKAFSSSVATKISEIEHLHGNEEREKPQGHDRGFLWRMNSYWRYQQVSGGVLVECESLTLSRSIPALLEYMIRPIIKKVARESMHRTLQSMRTRMVRSHQSNPHISNLLR